MDDLLLAIMKRCSTVVAVTRAAHGEGVRSCSRRLGTHLHGLKAPVRPLNWRGHAAGRPSSLPKCRNWSTNCSWRESVNRLRVIHNVVWSAKSTALHRSNS